MLDQISVVIITRNAADTLAETLESARGFDEVLVYDNGSDDTTLQIAQSYENVSLHEGEFMGFGPTKNHAISLARHDWVLSLDADEVISQELGDFLAGWTPANPHTVGVIRRDNYLMGQLVDKGGWGADWLVRLFDRKVHRFNDHAVHEKVETTTTTDKEKIPFPMRHNAIQQLGQFLIKADRYSEIRRQTSSKTFHPFLIVLRSFFAFFRSYVLNCGVLAGWRGLVIAWGESNGVFYKYMKIYADQNR
jgi:glycosyltransferase involved in cell wall biosynthesis